MVKYFSPERLQILRIKFWNFSPWLGRRNIYTIKNKIRIYLHLLSSVKIPPPPAVPQAAVMGDYYRAVSTFMNI
jgi:hypothetical protein